jgi:hypothetical protein
LLLLLLPPALAGLLLLLLLLLSVPLEMPLAVALLLLVGLSFCWCLKMLCRGTTTQLSCLRCVNRWQSKRKRLAEERVAGSTV